MKVIWLGLLFFLAPWALGAQDLSATVSETSGKVELQFTSGGPWKPAKIGDVLKKGTLVSTGFKSTAVLKVGTSVINVKPVTRLSLTELVKTKGGTQTQLYLTSGRVQVEVAKSKTEQTEFAVKSPTATASVRGTGFEFDGFNLLVTHGMVELGNNWGQYRYVGAGEYSFIDTDSSVSIPVAANPESGLEDLGDLIKQNDVDDNAGGGGISGGDGVLTQPKVTFSLTIN